jgi:uncharacterized metal-binding protein YceD (DUF177 family)
VINRVTILLVIRIRLHKLVFGAVGATQVEQLNLGPTQLDQDLTVQFLTGKLIFTRLNDTVMLEGSFDTEVTVQCVRSLEDFQLCRSIVLEDTFFALPGVESEEAVWTIDNEGWADLTEALREEVLMAIPINPISPKYAGVDDDTLPDGIADADREWLSIKWQHRDGEAKD